MRKSGTEVTVAELPLCDICKAEGKGEILAQYDGAMSIGGWAYMCQSHFDQYGVGLGVGMGQLLVVGKSAEGTFIDKMDVERKAALLARFRKQRAYDRRMQEAGGDESFALWMALVDTELARRVGLTSRDLEDFASRDSYESGASPAEAAEECMENSDLFGMMD